jgi:methyl-accepting chemotaxis protein
LHGAVYNVHQALLNAGVRLPEARRVEPDMPKEIFRALWTNIKGGHVFRGIVKNLKKDGTHYWVDAVISPVLGENGKPEKYIGVRYLIEDEELGQKLFDKQLYELGLTIKKELAVA